MNRFISFIFALSFFAGQAFAQSFGGSAVLIQPVTSGHCISGAGGNKLQDAGQTCGGSSLTPANPTATGGPAAVNGSATTYMRSDASPAIQKGTNAQFGVVEGDGSTLTCVAGVCSSIGGVSPANPTATIGSSAVNGTAGTFMRSDAAPALPATLPAISGANLTNLNGSNVASGTIAAARGGAGSINGILKANGSGTVSGAAAGTDYAPATSGASILYGNGSGGFSNATVGTGLSFSGGTLSSSVTSGFDNLGTATPSGVSTVSFTSIPQTYKSLMLVVSGRSAAAGAGATQVNAQFNSDTGGNYSHQYAYTSNGTAFSGNQNTGDTSAVMGQIASSGDAANYPGSFTAVIPDYTGTTFYKQVIFYGGFVFAATVSTNMYNTNGTSWWANTAAITRIDLVTGGTNYLAGTTITLYGLK